MGAINEVIEALRLVPLAAVDALEISDGNDRHMESLTGGSPVKREGKSGDMKEFAEDFERAKASA